jgi:hypothetical protein
MLGRCLRCGAPCDDYAARSRCALCRLLILLCGACAGREVRRCRALALCAGALAGAHGTLLRWRLLRL